MCLPQSLRIFFFFWRGKEMSSPLFSIEKLLVLNEQVVNLWSSYALWFCDIIPSHLQPWSHYTTLKFINSPPRPSPTSWAPQFPQVNQSPLRWDPCQSPVLLLSTHSQPCCSSSPSPAASPPSLLSSHTIFSHLLTFEEKTVSIAAQPPAQPSPRR